MDGGCVLAAMDGSWKGKTAVIFISVGLINVSQMPMDRDEFERAVDNIGAQNLFLTESHRIKLACLIREDDWRPLHAPWWRGKEAYVIGADIDGNFVLRHCDGSVRYWHHASAADTTIAKSVRDFARQIDYDPIG